MNRDNHFILHLFLFSWNFPLKHHPEHPDCPKRKQVNIVAKEKKKKKIWWPRKNATLTITNFKETRD